MKTYDCIACGLGNEDARERIEALEAEITRLETELLAADERIADAYFDGETAGRSRGYEDGVHDSTCELC